ncbi:MAG: hypothetical protein NW208_04035 [Bryobacter sp.]|nr:hypothetical protein [Bryobacter sp.]
MSSNRLFLLFTLVVCASSAQEFFTGQAARLIIGQKSFTAQFPGSDAEILGAAGGIAFAGNKLFVADASRIGAFPANNRVVIFDNLSSFVLPPDQQLPQGPRCPACVGKGTVVLGQPNFEVPTEDLIAATRIAADSMREATAVASDGVRVAVADTNFNRVLIWRSIPTSNGQPADIVLGQDSFDKLRPLTTNQRSLRGPQGVWIQDGKLFVADTMNHRVLIWNTFPTQNDQAADIVLGQANFDVAPVTDLTQSIVEPRQDNLLNPVSVTSDGQRLYVADLGHNRVLIWNTIPTRNQQPADIVIGQPDFTSAFANNSSALCEATGTDEETNEPIYPRRCDRTLDFPRFALSDGKRLFIADGGNDRVLIYNQIPTENAPKADAALGQRSLDLNLTSDSAFPGFVSAADVIRTPTSLATDGLNLYVADPYNRRVLVFTPGTKLIADTGVRNTASREIFAVGNFSIGGEAVKDEEIVVEIGEVEYKYKFVENDSLTNAINQLVTLINTRDGGNPDVFATPVIRPEEGLFVILLTARVAGADGNNVTYTVSVTPINDTTAARVQVNAGSGTLSGGQDAAQIAAGTIVSIFGENLTDRTASVPLESGEWPRGIQGTEVFFDGISVPLQSISPTEIVAHVPVEVVDASSSSVYVRSVRQDGSVVVSTPIGVPLIAQNPGIFAEPGSDPRPGIVTHFSSFATATISLDGTPEAGEVATVNINGREYKYTVVEGDDNFKIRDTLIELINAGSGDPEVFAFPSGWFTRLRLRARKEGPDGNGVPISVSTGSEDTGLILTAFNSELCCANVAGARVTEENPALPGETIVVLATGLGPILPEEANSQVFSGIGYRGPEFNEPAEFVSSIAGGRTANVLFAGLKPGLIGLYEVHLELNTDLDTNPATQLTIAQSFQVSNIVTFPVRNPRRDAENQ